MTRRQAPRSNRHTENMTLATFKDAERAVVNDSHVVAGKSHLTGEVPLFVILNTRSSQEALKSSNVQLHVAGLNFLTVSLGPYCVRMYGKSSPICPGAAPFVRVGRKSRSEGPT